MALASAACEPRPADSGANAPSGPPRRAQEDPRVALRDRQRIGEAQLAQLALSSVAHLRQEWTFGQWQATYPEDGVAGYDARKPEQIGANLCGTATTVAQAPLAPEIRGTAFFYPPPPPEPLVLPTSRDAGELISQCQLGVIVLETDYPDSVQAAQRMAGVRSEVASTLGALTTPEKLRLYAAPRWRDVGYWSEGDLELVVARGMLSVRDELASPAGAARLMTIAFGPMAPTSLRWNPFDRSSREYALSRAARARTLERIAEAVALAKGDNYATYGMRRHLELLADTTRGSRVATVQERDDFVSVLEAWVRGGTSRAPGQRAATLLAADLLNAELVPVMRLGDPKDSASRARLATVGAEFEYAELGGGFQSRHAWLSEAAAIDPAGRAGQLAFLALMERGFRRSPTCRDHGPEGFRVVIARGEAFLRDYPGATITAEVHLAIARAYGDIVSLATGGWDNDPAPYVGQRDAARSQAIAHYEAVFATGDSVLKRMAWNEAWRMLAGFDPTRTWFYCSYD